MSTSAFKPSSINAIASKDHHHHIAMAARNYGGGGAQSGRPFLNLSDHLASMASQDTKRRTLIDDFQVPSTSSTCPQFQLGPLQPQHGGLCSVDARSNQFEACKVGDLESVKSLVNASNVNLKDTFGRKSTCLHFAAGFGRKDVCEYLLADCKADPCVKDEG